MPRTIGLMTGTLLDGANAACPYVGGELARPGTVNAVAMRTPYFPRPAPKSLGHRRHRMGGS